MILLVLIASVLIAGVTIYQYREQSRDYHQNRLERKEEQILQRVAFGESNKAIARRLGISPFTVDAALRVIYGKLKCHNRTLAALRAANAGMIDVSTEDFPTQTRDTKLSTL